MKLLALFVLLASSLVGCASHAPAPKTPSHTSVAPEVKTAFALDHRAPITASGYAVIGVQNHTSAPQQRLLAIRAAKVDAYRGLAEQVYGIRLDANTMVSDMTVMSDTFRTRVEGVIYGATLTSITPINLDTYEVTLTLGRDLVNDLRVLYLEQLNIKRH